MTQLKLTKTFKQKVWRVARLALVLMSWMWTLLSFPLTADRISKENTMLWNQDRLCYQQWPVYNCIHVTWGYNQHLRIYNWSSLCLVNQQKVFIKSNRDASWLPNTWSCRSTVFWGSAICSMWPPSWKATLKWSCMTAISQWTGAKMSAFFFFCQWMSWVMCCSRSFVRDKC